MQYWTVSYWLGDTLKELTIEAEKISFHTQGIAFRDADDGLIKFLGRVDRIIPHRMVEE